MIALRRAAVYALLGIWSFVCLGPVWWLLLTSIKSGADIDRPPGYLPFVDFRPTLDAWHFILFDDHDKLVPALVHSVLVAIASTLLTVGSGCLAVYALTRCAPRLRWTALVALAVPVAVGAASVLADGKPGAALLAASLAVGVWLAVRLRDTGPRLTPEGTVAVMLASRVLPPAVLALPLYVFGERLGARDHLWFLIFVHSAINLPVAVWLILPHFGPRATDQEEAAQLDGASHLLVLFTILVPMIRAGIVAVGLIVFLLSWNEYLFAAYLTSGQTLTLPVWAVGQLSMKEAQVGGGPEEVAHLAAASMVMILPALALAATALRGFGRRPRSGPG